MIRFSNFHYNREPSYFLFFCHKCIIPLHIFILYMLKTPICILKTALRECAHMHAIKTALRESFLSHTCGLGGLTIKNETDRGK